MNREDIIRMAREAGMDTLNGWRDDNTVSEYYEAWPEQLERFAAIVAAAEREACAKVCDQVGYHHEVQQGAELAFDLASAIRARGETTSRGQA